jgi:hypothetical protein
MAGQVRSLADGRISWSISRSYSLPGNRYGTTSSRGIRFAQFHADAAQSGHPPSVVRIFLGGGQVGQTDPFGLGSLDFLFPGRHFRPGATIDDLTLFGTQPNGRAGHVDGHIAAADDGHVFAHRRTAGQVDFPQEIDALADTPGLFPGNAQGDALVGAQGQVDRLESLFEKGSSTVRSSPSGALVFNSTPSW